MHRDCHGYSNRIQRDLYGISNGLLRECYKVATPCQTPSFAGANPCHRRISPRSYKNGNTFTPMVRIIEGPSLLGPPLDARNRFLIL